MSVAEQVKSHITNFDGNWGTSHFKTKHLEDVVTNIHFVAHANHDNLGSDGYPPTNHWSLYLQVEQRSIHVDTAPGDVGRPGMVIIEDDRVDSPDDLVHAISVPTPHGTTVANILKIIIDNRRDHYVFASIGEGCRFWLYNVASDLVDAHIMSREKVSEVQEALHMYWPFPVGTLPQRREMLKGRFV